MHDDIGTKLPVNRASLRADFLPLEGLDTNYSNTRGKIKWKRQVIVKHITGPEMTASLALRIKPEFTPREPTYQGMCDALCVRK